jgi:hypothetical protein
MTTTAPTTATNLPQQLRLPGQTAAHPGPVDMSMMYVMHHAFRRDLAALAAAAAATPASATSTWVALAARWELFNEALHHHHTGEDTGLWPTLMERTDDAGREVLVAMESEHAEMDSLLRSCSEGFARMATTPDEDTRGALAIRVAATRERIGEHLRHEETDAIAIIQQTLTNEDWHNIDETYFKRNMSFSKVLALVPWVLHGVPGPVRDGLFAGPGGRAYKLVWRLTRRRFERADKAAFAYVAR